MRCKAHKVMSISIVFLDCDYVKTFDLKFSPPFSHDFYAFDFLVRLRKLHDIEAFYGLIEAFL